MFCSDLWKKRDTILYRIFFWKPWNPKERLESFDRQFALLKFVGLWPPQQGSTRARFAYKVYGWCFRIIFLYVYTITQALYFLNVQDLRGVADTLFLLMTQVSLLIKLEVFNSNIERIQKCVRQIQCAFYDPRNDEERKVVVKAMHTTWLIGTMFMTVAYGSVTFWTVSALLKKERVLPLPSWFPFDYKKSLPVFIAVWLYQVFGIYMSATYNVATETLITGLISHVSGQAGRLGIMISKIPSSRGSGIKLAVLCGIFQIGYETDEVLNYTDGIMKHDLDFECHTCDQLSHLRKNRSRYDCIFGSTYSYLVGLVLFHKGLSRFGREVIDIFNVSIFTQVMSSVIIICMTGLRILSGTNNLLTIVGDVVYLITMIWQIFQFCYVGSEISFQNEHFRQMTVFCNYLQFNRPIAKVFLIYLVRIMQPTEIKVGIVFDFTLSLSTFLWILKTSYSYFAVLKSIQ